MIIAAVTLIIFQMYLFLQLKSSHRHQIETVARIAKVKAVEFKAVNDSIVRYENDYNYLKNMAKVSGVSLANRKKGHNLKALDKAFKAFDQWGNVHSALETRRERLKYQLYTNQQTTLRLDKNLERRFKTIQVLMSTEALLGLVYLIFVYVINLWFNDTAFKSICVTKKLQ